MSKRSCQGTNKCGEPCKATPLKASEFCSAHDPNLPESARFGSRTQAKGAAKLAGRPPKPKPTEVLRQRLEREIDKWLAPLEEALEAEMAVTVGFGKDAYLEMIPDYRTRLQAHQMAFDRIYGKAKQSTELSGPEGQPVRVELPTEADWHAQVAQVLGQVGAVAVPPAGLVLNGNGNGHSNGNGNGHGPDQN